jgi:hypothetical protein
MKKFMIILIGIGLVFFVTYLVLIANFFNVLSSI